MPKVVTTRSRPGGLGIKRQKSFRELSNVGIDRIFRGEPRYAGTFSKDQLPTPAQVRGRFIVINLQSHNAGPGTHWTMLWDAGRGSGAFYFDSMGEVPPSSVRRLMNALGDRNAHDYNPNEVQEFDSITCGYFCCYVAKRLLAGQSVAKVLGGFSTKDFARNEAMVKAAF